MHYKPEVVHTAAAWKCWSEPQTPGIPCKDLRTPAVQELAQGFKQKVSVLILVLDRLQRWALPTPLSSTRPSAKAR